MENLIPKTETINWIKQTIVLNNNNKKTTTKERLKTTPFKQDQAAGTI